MITDIESAKKTKLTTQAEIRLAKNIAHKVQPNIQRSIATSIHCTNLKDLTKVYREHQYTYPRLEDLNKVQSK